MFYINNMPNESLNKQRTLVDKESNRLALMEERQKLMDELWSLSTAATAWSRNARWGSYQPNWWPLNWIYWVADRDIRKRSDKAINRLNEINKELADMNKAAPTWPVKQDTQWIKDYINSIKQNWWWDSKWWDSKWWGSRSWWSRTWNSWAIKQQPSTYVDPNWVTHTWMTQDEFNQSMQMYEADNQWWYESQRNKTLPWWTTRWQLFDQALNKYLDNPDSFDDSAKQALINVWKQLWYWWDNWQASQQSQPTAQPNVQPTVQPSVQPAQTQSQYNWFDPSQVWWRTWLWTELDRRTQWWQINIPFSL